VSWQEGVRPVVVIELLSPGTQDEDLGEESPRESNLESGRSTSRSLGVPYYITFNRYNDELQAFQLVGNRYQMESMAGRIWMPDLELGCSMAREYRALRQWLRWYDAQGNWVPTEAEREDSRKS